jgi:hypothetical protein
MKEKTMEKLQEPPQYHGFFCIYSKGWIGSYLDRGSRRFLSMAAGPKRNLFASMIFTYFAEDDHSVDFVTQTARHRFRRIFVTTAFPYLSFSAKAKGAYKCLHWCIARVHPGAKNQLVINADPALDTFSIGDVATVDAVQIIADFAIAEARVLAIEARTKSASSLQEQAVLDHSLRSMTKQIKDPAVLQNLRQSYIRLCTTFLVNHRSAHTMLKLWVAEEKSLGRSEAASSFVAELAQISHPLALARHGYNLSFANLDLTEVARELHQLMQHLAELGGKPFLNSGTLLGYYRDGRPIVHDDDFDLGIWLEGETEAEVFANWHAFVAKVKACYRIVNKGSFLSVRMSNGVQVDLFAAWTLRGRATVFPYCFEECAASDLVPLGLMKIAGMDFAAPAAPESLLAINYGPNWRVPDPYWCFDYRRAKRLFKSAMKQMKAS